GLLMLRRRAARAVLEKRCHRLKCERGVRRKNESVARAQVLARRQPRAELFHDAYQHTAFPAGDRLPVELELLDQQLGVRRDNAHSVISQILGPYNAFVNQFGFECPLDSERTCGPTSEENLR